MTNASVVPMKAANVEGSTGKGAACDKRYGALEQIGFKLNHNVVQFRRVNLLYHIDIRANDIVELEAFPLPTQQCHLLEPLGFDEI